MAINEDKSDPTVRGHRVRQLVHEVGNAKLEENGTVNAQLIYCQPTRYAGSSAGKFTYNDTV